MFSAYKIINDNLYNKYDLLLSVSWNNVSAIPVPLKRAKFLKFSSAKILQYHLEWIVAEFFLLSTSDWSN